MGRTGLLFERLNDLNIYLRSPDGCMWDREQTVESLRKCIESEAAEVIKAIDSGDRDNLCEELGDLLYNILFISHAAEVEGAFTLNQVLDRQYDKMVARHPHVFADIKADDRESAKKAYLRAKEGTK